MFNLILRIYLGASKLHSGGYIFKPLNDAARKSSSQRGTWKVHYILLSEAGLQPFRNLVAQVL